MENIIYTQAELRRDNILTDEYALNLEPGDYLARLDLKAETPRRNDCLRVFFTFEDGRKVMSTVHWFKRYLGFQEIPVGTQLQLTYSRTARNAVYLTAAEIVELRCRRKWHCLNKQRIVGTQFRLSGETPDTPAFRKEDL